MGLDLAMLKSMLFSFVLLLVFSIGIMSLFVLLFQRLVLFI